MTSLTNLIISAGDFEMRPLMVKIVILMVFSVFQADIFAQENTGELPLLQGPYLGQEPPGLTPKVFAPDFVSTKDVSEFSCTFSKDGKEFYFARNTGPQQFTILYTKDTGNGWTEPEPAPFSGDYFNHEPYVSFDGNKIYWGSMRPLPDGKTEYSIWVADRTSDGWGTPYPLGFPAMYVTSNSTGTLYYTGRGRGGACLAKAELKDGEYVTEILGEPLISDYWDGHPCIAPDGSYIIFDSENRPENEECGLFISFKKENGNWTEPVNMKQVISKGRYAMFSPEGKYIFFSAPGEGEGKDLWWISAEVVEKLRPESLK